MNVRQSVEACLKLLDVRARRHLSLATLAQMATSVLDLVGVLLLGLVGSLAVASIQEVPPPPLVQTAMDYMGLGDLSDEGSLAVFAVCAAFVLLVKSILASYLLRRVFRFLAGQQAKVSARLTEELLDQPLAFINRRSSQTTAYALIQGAGAATLYVLGLTVVVLSESALLILLGITLFAISPLIALGSIAFFGLVALVLQLLLGTWASRAGRTMANADVQSLDAIQEVLGAYREISVADRRSFYTERITKLRWEAARVSADIQLASTLPKYVFEVALVVGGFALAAILLATQESAEAIGTLAIFLAAASRVMPSILRLQGATISLRNVSGLAGPTLELASDLERSCDGIEKTPKTLTQPQRGNIAFEPDVEIRAVDFSYADASSPALRNISLSIPRGTSVALVGMSGAGKTTLADLILGVLQPDRGEILVGGQPPRTATRVWPGGIAYVPQDVTLANTSIRMNVALGVSPREVDEEKIWKVLRQVGLSQSLAQGRAGLDTPVGERGVKLSGGQRQRLGIARALYSSPRLVVLDEATSSLDAESEAAISSALLDMAGTTTRIIIAHRLSTVRDVDQVVYLERGRIACVGTFEEVRRRVPAFDRQAKLMGLN